LASRWTRRHRSCRARTSQWSRTCPSGAMKGTVRLVAHGDSPSSLGAAGFACRLTSVTAGTRSDWTAFGPTCAGFARLVAYIYKSSRRTTESRTRLGGTYGGNLVEGFLSMPAPRFAQDAYHSIAATGRKSGSRRGGPVWTTKVTNPHKVKSVLSLCHKSGETDT
jgi:hypothetical protein